MKSIKTYRGRRYSYAATYLAFLNSHGIMARKGYRWFVIDRSLNEIKNRYTPNSVIQACLTRREARELCYELNTRGFVTLESVIGN